MSTPITSLTAQELEPSPAQHPKADSFFCESDVLVAGGGPSGLFAAISAARSGARVVLLERFGRLGGAGVVNMVNPLMGDIDSPISAEFHERFAAIDFDWEQLDLLYADMALAAGVEFFLHTWVVGPLLEGNRVVGVRTLSKQGVLDFRARVVVDASADGDVAYGAGVPYEQGRAEDGRVQPVTIMYRLGGVDKSRALLCGCEEEAVSTHLPSGQSWHDVVMAGRACGELPDSVGIIRIYESNRTGERVINATQVNGIDGTKVRDLTKAEIEGRRQAHQVTAFLREHAPGYEECFISAMPAAIGVRETRRFRGLYWLTREDLMVGRPFPDAIVRNAFFPIDIHNPDGVGQAEGFAARPQAYEIPMRCLLPEKVEGLVLTGRNISGSHDAHASYRVQKIAQGIGAASGTLAALAALRGKDLRDIPAADVQHALGLAGPKE